MYIHLHTIHTEYIDIQMKPNASLKKLIAFLPFLPFHPCKPYFINIYTHPSLLLIKLMSVKMFVVWQIYIIEHYRKMLPNRFYFCYDNDVIFMNTSHISRYIIYRFIFCPWTVLLECIEQQKKLVREYHMFYIISNIAATLIMYYVCIKQLLQIRYKYSIAYERIYLSSTYAGYIWYNIFLIHYVVLSIP